MKNNYLIDQNEDQIILECLKIVVAENIFPLKDFSSIFNESIEEINQIILDWDTVNLDSEGVLSAINSTLNNIIGFPHGHHTNIENKIKCTTDDLDEILDKILNSFNKNPIIKDEDLKFNANKNCKMLKEDNFDIKDLKSNYIGKYLITENIGIEIYKDKIIYNEFELLYSNISRGKGWINECKKGVITIFTRNTDKIDIEFELNESSIENANDFGQFISSNCYPRKYNSLKYFRRLWIK